MMSLKIIADGKTDAAKANARGKLFEKVTAATLRYHGYDIDRHQSNVVHAGMEIDVEGKSRITGIPMYAECKCYSSNIDCEKLQTFFGKYMTRWFLNKKSQGLFLAIPGINSSAMGFYKENCESNSAITLRLLQEPEVLDALINGQTIVNPAVFQGKVSLDGGTPGDQVLVCSDKGSFWIQYIVPPGAGVASQVQVFDALGNTISDQGTVAYLSELLPELRQFQMIKLPPEISSTYKVGGDAIDEVVQLRGSSSCFEYQFPAAPEFFVGREALICEIDTYADEVIEKQTSCRAILFEANSGWGKSSLVLATVDRLLRHGHYAVAFDSRSASTPHFVLRVVEHVLKRFGDFDGCVPAQPVVGGVDGASQALISIGRQLEQHKKVLFIFFDQFENIFYLLDVLTRIAQLCLSVGDAATNIVLGFSWKTDLVGLTREFPYRWRDIIIDSSKLIRLPQFSDTETGALLDLLAKELNTKLRKDLRFLLSDFSQGYPWLLKKLCAHVRNQRQSGVPQADMVRALLNVEQLFLDDLQGLTTQQESVLRRTARLAPVNIWDLADEFSPELVQSLVDRRLIVKVGSKYDVYWDIFRDYLNTGKLPIEEVYLPRAQVGSILNAVTILSKAGGHIDITLFKQRAGLSDGAFLNILRDLRLLQLVRIDDQRMELLLSANPNEQELIANIRTHLQDRLPRNRCVYRALNLIRERNELNIAQLGLCLRDEFPYVSAVGRTWETYARILASWIDLADLAILDDKKTKLSKYEVGSQIRDRSLSFASKRSGVTVPAIHFAPVVQVATRIANAAQKKEAVDWSGIRRSTIYKSLSMLEEMALVSRRSNSIYVKPECYPFALDPDRRLEIGRAAALKWPVFSTFIRILTTISSRRISHKVIAQRLSEDCGVEWKRATVETNVKIMLDWARHLGLAPGVHAYAQRGRFKGLPDGELDLFESLGK